MGNLHRSDRPYKTGIGFQGRFLVRGAFSSHAEMSQRPKARLFYKINLANGLRGVAKT